MCDMRFMTCKQALEMAKALSGMTLEEIARKSRISMNIVVRYFREGDNYCPGLEAIPVLCRALGNTILIDWQRAQLESLESDTPASNANDVIRAVLLVGSSVGKLHQTTDDALSDGRIDAREGVSIANGAKGVEEAARKLRSNIGAFAGQVMRGGKWEWAEFPCDDDKGVQ